MSHNLLAANWEQQSLSRMMLLGNSFIQIAENWSNLSDRLKQGKSKPEGILRLVNKGAVVDVQVKECNFPVRGAFNDMSVMFLPQMSSDLGMLEVLSLEHLLPKEAL